MNKLIFFSLLIIAVIFETIADISFKYSGTQSKQIWLWFGVVLYTIGTLIWAYSLRYEYLSKAISMFTVLNLIAVILAGVIFFQENLSLINKVGIGLGIISVILIQL